MIQIARKSEERGFTLLEVLISMLILGVVMGSMVPMFVAQLKHNTQSETRQGAIAAAELTLDALRIVDPIDMPESGSNDPVDVTVDDRTYQVTTSFCQSESFCTSSNNRHISIEVNYNENAVYSVDTVFTRLR